MARPSWLVSGASSSAICISSNDRVMSEELDWKDPELLANNLQSRPSPEGIKETRDRPLSG
jgi:hypothetical protein